MGSEEKQQSAQRANEISHNLALISVQFLADRRMKIFSWASTLIFGSIAGKVFFADRIDPDDIIFLEITISVLAAYSIFWLLRCERALRVSLKHLGDCNEKLGIKAPPVNRAPSFAFEWTVGLLWFLATVMIFWP